MAWHNRILDIIRAPEISTGKYDTFADIFSYGIVLAEIITRGNYHLSIYPLHSHNNNSSSRVHDDDDDE